MKQANWPGVATTVGIAVIATIVFAIWRDPTFQLKDWQTLIAACVALFAATLAYRGAIAKVDLDRDAQQTSLRREKLAVFLKLEIALALLKGELNRTRTWFDVFDRHVVAGQGMNGRDLTARSFVIAYPTELSDAWSELDLFPESLITELANIRSALRTIEASVEQWGIDKEWSYNQITMPAELRRMADIYFDVEQNCVEAVRQLRSNIEDLRNN